LETSQVRIVNMVLDVILDTVMPYQICWQCGELEPLC
jgi:hypothetical protein